MPRQFRVGYLGSFGPDKGVRYLLESWKRLGYRDATLVLAGRDSASEWGQRLIREFGGGNIEVQGWVSDPADFYAGISLYVQPSVTEGFGLEVLESMGHGRPVLCSTGAGAADCVPSAAWTFQPRDVGGLAEGIDLVKRNQKNWKPEEPAAWRQLAEPYAWDKVRRQYQDHWRKLL
jgi:glycosyltransferase involved in cell wall biosynthesis